MFICSCGQGFSSCPYEWDVCNSRISAKQELTVFDIFRLHCLKNFSFPIPLLRQCKFFKVTCLS